MMTVENPAPPAGADSPPNGVIGNEQRLRRGALGILDISAATMANIGPAMSFFFGFGLIAATAGLASPLTIVAAAIAIALLGNTLAQFARAQPSAGGFITFVGKTFGGTSAVATALIAGIGYITALSAVIAVSGGFLSITLQRYLHWNVPWGILTLILTGLAVFIMVRGVAVSTKLAGFFFGFEMLVLVVISVTVLIRNGGHLSLAPLEPSHITNGLSGLAAGFPLAIYLFVGWENSAALAEETDNPRRNVPRAVFTSIAIMAVSYVLFAYATVTGFGYSTGKLGQSAIPFITVADSTLGVFAFFAYLAGLTSTLGALIAGTNSQARLLFNAGREGLLPRWLGEVHPTRRTPVNSIFVFISIALVIIGVWALLHVVTGSSGAMDSINYFDEASTMGTVLILLVYLLSNLALPFYYRKYRPSEFRWVKHGVLPALGAIAIVVPLYYLAKPGQPTPYDWFPYAALGIAVIATSYAFVLNRRDSGLAGRVGSLVADE
jgi:amino acid transporter